MFRSAWSASAGSQSRPRPYTREELATRRSPLRAELRQSNNHYPKGAFLVVDERLHEVGPPATIIWLDSSPFFKLKLFQNKGPTFVLPSAVPDVVVRGVDRALFTGACACRHALHSPLLSARARATSYLPPLSLTALHCASLRSTALLRLGQVEHRRARPTTSSFSAGKRSEPTSWGGGRLGLDSPGPSYVPEEVPARRCVGRGGEEGVAAAAVAVAQDDGAPSGGRVPRLGEGCCRSARVKEALPSEGNAPTCRSGPRCRP